MTSQIAQGYFEFIANLGVTKHPGSMESTREIMDLCRIDNETYVLDVGCGVGATPSYLAKTTGCRVVGVDLLDKMIEHSKKRAKTDGVEDRVEFRMADANELPFEDNQFDVVLSESVNVFLDAKRRAMSEYVRVTKPGGYVSITEMTWLKPPSSEMVEYYKQVAYVLPEEAQGWRVLMEEAGLKEVVGRTSNLDVSSEAKGRIERYG